MKGSAIGLLVGFFTTSLAVNVVTGSDSNVSAWCGESPCPPDSLDHVDRRRRRLRWKLLPLLFPSKDSVGRLTTSVLLLDLINADSDRKVITLSNGMVIESATTPSFTVSAVLTSGTSSSSVKSVKFGYNGNAQLSLDNVTPYEMCGYTSTSRYLKCNQLSYGNHSVTATPYSLSNGRGTAGTPVQVTFSIVRPRVPTKTPIRPPNKAPIRAPTRSPTIAPAAPTRAPLASPTTSPFAQTAAPNKAVTTRVPTNAPTNIPTKAPTKASKSPTRAPTKALKSPTRAPTKAPTKVPASPKAPTKAPKAPTKSPTKRPTKSPTKASPTKAPTAAVVSNFNIQLDLSTISTAADKAVFSNAAAKWQRVITSDLSDFNTNTFAARTDSCTWPTVIDDLFICAEYQPYDGPYNVLCFAGPECVRVPSAAHQRKHDV
jgi:hypothetical protein